MPTIYHLPPHIEMPIRLSFFFSILVIMMIWQYLSPRRTLTIPKVRRWTSNLSITIIDSILVRILFPTAAVGVALYTEHNQIGYFNHVLSQFFWVKVLASIILLDCVIYLQHVMFHSVPLFWRFHRMHHTDLDFDVTTGVRFHPFEIVISMLIKFGAIILIGAPAIAVILFEIILNATSMFNHSNVYLPLAFDKILRRFIVTPDMHRVHHSTIPNETNSNFGFNLSIWDRIFGTYKNQPQLGHIDMNIGINSIRDHKFCVNLFGMLWIPFLKENQEYPINRKPLHKKD